MAETKGAVETLLSAALRLGFRLELATVGAAATAWLYAARSLRPLGASLVVSLPIIALVAWPRGRRFTWRQVRYASIRRRFGSAIRATSFDRTRTGRTPQVVKVRESRAGYLLTVRLPVGTSATDLDNAAEVAAAAMGVSDIRITRDAKRASIATAAVILRDPLAGPPLAWPLGSVPRWSLWDPIPVGIDDHGNTVSVSLPEHNVLIGGEPGAGKSAALSLLLAAAALDPAVTLWLLDGKRVELAAWESCATRLIGPSLDEAAEVLDGLRAEMDARYAQLLAWRRRKVADGDGLGLHVVVIDELALYLASGRKRPGNAWPNHSAISSPGAEPPG